MKVRNGFVSNSSSSSFIVKLDRPIEDYQSYEQFAEIFDIYSEYEDYGRRLFDDLKEKTNNDIEDLYICVDIVGSNLLYEKTNEIEEKARKYVKKLVAKEYTKNKEENIYTVEYSDDDGQFYSYMEHDFMPYFNGTVEAKNYH